MVDARQLVLSEVMQTLTLPAASFSHTTDLYQLGLHSLQILRLSERFSQLCGTYIGYLSLASQPTLAQWTALLEQAVMSSSHDSPCSDMTPGGNQRQGEMHERT